MNIQQINGSGHSIWIFPVISVAALFVTGLTWYIIEEINKVRISLRKIAKDGLGEVSNNSLAFRMFMLWWLVQNGHLSWTWETRAWKQILSNSSSEFVPLRGNKIPWTREGRELKTACDYVAYHMNSEKVSNEKPFAIGGAPDVYD